MIARTKVMIRPCAVVETYELTVRKLLVTSRSLMQLVRTVLPLGLLRQPMAT